MSYAVVQFGTLEQLRRVGAHLGGGRPLTASEDAGIGFVVGMAASAATEPIDLVRTRIMTQVCPVPCPCCEAL